MPLRRITNCRPPAKSNETGVTAKMLIFFFPKINATKSKGLDRIRQTTTVGDDTCSQKISERLLSRNIPLSVQLPPRAVKTDHFHSPVRGKSFFFLLFFFLAFAFWNIIVDRSVHLFVWRIPNQLRQKPNFLRSLTCLYLHHWPPGNQLVSLTDDPNTQTPAR